jgi:putative cardiolipin synthase
MKTFGDPAFVRKMRITTWGHILAVIVLVASLALLNGCATLPRDYSRSASYALEPGPDSKLEQVAKRVREEFGPDMSGFVPISRNDEALLSRLMLADLAEHSVDVQVFIWQADEGGVLLLDRLLRAADRGVRVRLLIDDLLLLGGDRDIAILNHHPNLEIRVFNPWQRRSYSGVIRGLEFIFHIKRLNHRMHNKLIVADNRMAIVGGRNIGNEYFGLNSKYNFGDFDVITVGPIAREVSRSFDIYWNSEWAYPGEGLARDMPTEDSLLELRELIKKGLDDSKDSLNRFPMEPRSWNDRIGFFLENMVPGLAKVVYDEPLIGADVPPAQLVESLRDIAFDAREEVLVMSPYFIPHGDFFENLHELTSRGVQVKILTNSLASTNHAIVHSAYRRYRRSVIEAGGELYEFRPDAEVKAIYDTPPVQAEVLGMHTKLLVVDRHRVFVGSLNLDPRSIYINTEMGLLIEAPELAEEIARLIERDLKPGNSWRVRVDEAGRLVFDSHDGVIRREPARSFGQRVAVGFYRLLPIENQL